MNPKKCAPFFNKKEHTDLTAFYETLERNYPKRMTFNEAAALMAGAFVNFSKPMPMIIMLVAAFILGYVGDRLIRTLRKQIDEEVKEA